MLGRLAYRFRATFRHGISAAYWREWERRRILGTPPIVNTADPQCEIHVLTSSDDWLNLLWTLKSFYAFSQRNYALCIHDDGTLSPQAIAAIHQHFPSARLIKRFDADQKVISSLAAFPGCANFRRTNTLSLKIFDFRHYLRSDRMLLLDSDILFFSKPEELLRRIESRQYLFNSANPDVASSYTVAPEVISQQFGFELGALFNSGLALIHRDSLKLEWMEEFLGVPGILDHHWRAEQTLFALCSSRFGSDLLPDEYRVRLVPSSSGFCCKHYVGAIRQHMYDTGMRQLIRSGFLKDSFKRSATEPLGVAV